MLLKVRKLAVKKLQIKLAASSQKKQWFTDREESIEIETLKLEEESREARKKGDIRRERMIQGFLQSLKEALPAIKEKKNELELEVVHLQHQLEEASKKRKVVEKLEELHYNQKALKRRKHEG